MMTLNSQSTDLKKYDLSRYLKQRQPEQYYKRSSTHEAFTILPRPPLTKKQSKESKLGVESLSPRILVAKYVQKDKHLSVPGSSCSCSSRSVSPETSVSFQSQVPEQQTQQLPQQKVKHHRETIKEITRRASQALHKFSQGRKESILPRQRISFKRKLQSRELMKSESQEREIFTPKSVTLQMIAQLHKPPQRVASLQRIKTENVLHRGLTDRRLTTDYEFQYTEPSPHQERLSILIQAVQKKKVVVPAEENPDSIQRQYELAKKEEKLQANFLKDKFKQATIAKWMAISQLQDYFSRSPQSRRVTMNPRIEQHRFDNY